MNTLSVVTTCLLGLLAPMLASAQIGLVNIAHTNDGGNAQGIAVSGNYAYLAAGTNGLLIYDVSNPAQPLNVGHSVSNLSEGFTVYDVVVSGNYAYAVVTGNTVVSGLFVFDVSNPAAPAEMLHTNLHFFGGLAILGTNLYLGGDSRLPDFGISNPAFPVLITNFSLGPNPTGLAVSSNYLVAVAGSTLNIAGLTNGVYTNLAVSNLTENILGVGIAGQYVLLAVNGSNAFQSYFISSSNTITKAGQVTYPSTTSTGTGNGLAISWSYAYMACSAGVRAISIADPEHPLAAGQTITNFGGTPLALAVSGRYVFLANGSDGLRVFAVQPQLGVSGGGNNGLAFAWPAQGTFVLQQSSNLSGGNWITVTNVPAITAGNAQVNLSPPSADMFYRLLGQ